MSVYLYMNNQWETSPRCPIWRHWFLQKGFNAYGNRSARPPSTSPHYFIVSIPFLRQIFSAMTPNKLREANVIEWYCITLASEEYCRVGTYSQQKGPHDFIGFLAAVLPSSANTCESRTVSLIWSFSPLLLWSEFSKKYFRMLSIIDNSLNPSYHRT